MSLRDKLKIKSDIRESIASESKAKRTDSRILNYYDLKAGQKMRVLIMPDPEGDMWTSFQKHGPNMKVRGLPSIGVPKDSRDNHAVQKAYDLLAKHKETDDVRYKELAKKWFPRDYRLMNVIVLESPVSVPESHDGNQCKLVYVPYAIQKLIKEMLVEGVIDPNEVTTTAFVIKKTKNGAGFNDYSTSHFERKQIDDSTLASLEDKTIEPYNLSTIDIVPESPTSQQMTDWVEKAQRLLDMSLKNKHEATEEQLDIEHGYYEPF